MADYASDFETNEEFVNLLSDDELQLASEDGRSLHNIISDFLENVRPKTIEKLEELLKVVEKSYDDSRKARVAGTSATITGSVLAIVGFGLSFVTLGGSLGLTVVGATLAAAGGVTLGGAEVGYLAVSRRKTKEAKEACEEDNKEMHKIEIQGRKFSDHLDSLVEKHPIFSKETIFHVIKHTWKSSTTPAVRGFYTGYKVIDGASDVGRNIISVTKTARVGAQIGARTLYFGLGTVGRVFSVGSVALDVIFIPVDIFVLAKSAYDIHNYKTKKKSNSSAAADIKSILTQLNENKEELIRVRDELTGQDSAS